ncbi:cyclin-dependent kinase inhibitor 3-like isoform X2 [Nicotiana tomentosiformis]|uniref:cyclin-dependent kinase inhibitor 3-like isoform X2 n=1 Tax=Nicotiana tomentosiformis TaxID=4098 RepID=UPI00051BC8FE|nr:cyclin-dependent kinase inhibitor 3-like isoform X2 [Nicotiana tomentosiformis]
MGKYMRKAKITGDVAVMEVSQATPLGVRTRARTLALQRLHSSSTSPPPSASASASDSCYLQLRSRRLEKPPTPLSDHRKTKNLHTEENPKSDSRFLVSGSVGSVSITQKDGFLDVNEISFGENTLDFEHRDSTRESTPCSLVMEADGTVNPGSATRRTNLNTTAQRTRDSILRNIPSAQEMEEFFTFAEQQQQRLFMEKYNFDVVNDLPLTGRYEWIRVDY